MGEDGATHQGVFDLSYLRSIPNMTVSAPMDEEELRNLMYTAQSSNKGPFSIRYPRGKGVMSDWRREFKELPIGKGREISKGEDIAILSIGTTGNTVVSAVENLKKENISVQHYDMRYVKPLDEDILHKVFKKFKKVITIEDGTIIGGLGSAVLEFMSDNDYKSKIVRMGVPDKFINHGTPEELYRDCGFDVDGIYKTVKSLVKHGIFSNTG